MLTQLIINGTEYPQASNDNYKCYTEDLGKLLRMGSGRAHKEVRGRIWVIRYAYDYFGDALMQTCLTDLRSDEWLEVSFLPPAGLILQNSHFVCVQEPKPEFAFDHNGRPVWHNVSFTLEEAEAW